MITANVRPLLSLDGDFVVEFNGKICPRRIKIRNQADLFLPVAAVLNLQAASLGGTEAAFASRSSQSVTIRITALPTRSPQ